MDRFSRLTVFLTILALGGMHCSRLSKRRYPTRHHSPLANSDWQPLVPRRGTVSGDQGSRTGPTSDNPSDENRIELRRLMVAEAKRLVQENIRESGFCAPDLENIFGRLELNIEWRARSGLADLVEIGRGKGAYLNAGDPFPGDIVLFHNQWDANENGEVDDEFTGCGIAVSSSDGRLEVIVRTGHRARTVFVWPDRHQERTVGGEVVNSFLRIPNRTDPPEVRYLAGQLYAGYLDIELLLQNSLE